MNHNWRLLGFISFLLLTAVLISGCWADAIPIPHPVSTYGFAQCPDDVDNFYIVGGRDGWDSSLDHLLRYEVSTQTWYRLAPLPVPAVAPSAACYQGHLYVVTYDQHLFIYDIEAESWSEAAQPPRAAWGAALGIWDGMLYLVSGSPLEWDQPVSDVDRYDIAADTWYPGAGQPIPVAVILPGYVQTGPYLFVVGGFGVDSPEHNVDATQRYDMSSNTWQAGPDFSSARAAFALAAVGNKLYAMGGDADGGDFLDETSQVEFIDLNLWPSGSWVPDDAMPQALMFNSSGFCSEFIAQGEVWSVGGAYPDWEQLNAVTANRNFGGGRAEDEQNSFSYQSIPSLPYSDEEIARQYVQGIGNCQLGVFNFALRPANQQATGLPGEVITYTLSLTNTGDIPDAYDITVTSNWPTSIASFNPPWSQQILQLAVSVEIPQDALPGDADTAAISFTSQGDPALSQSVSLATERYVGLVLEPPAISQAGIPGESLVYPITLYNATGQTDSFDLVLGSHAWEVTLSTEQVGPLPDASAAVFTVTVIVPPDASWNLTDTVVVTATGTLAPYYADSSSLLSQAYAPPQISVAPLALESAQFPDQVVTQTLTITNSGYSPLEFYIGEGGDGDVLALHLDEPAGSTTFYDSSGNGHHGTCTTPACPVAGVPGMFGTAVTFDGSDDSVDVGNWFDLSSFTIAMWVRDNGSQVGFADIMDNNHDGDSSWVIQQMGPDWPSYSYRFYVAGPPEYSVRFDLNPGVWQFLVITADETSRVINVYINGNLVGSAMGENPVHYDGAQFLRLARWGAGGRNWNGSMDEVIIFNKAFSPEEVQALYQEGYWHDDFWLYVEPISGTVPTEGSLPIQVTFDATNLQPDIYTTTLSVSSNDPLNPSVQVPVTMTVEPTPSMGWVEGYLTDLRSGEPLEATIIAEGQPYTITSDAETGYYQLWLEQGSYTLAVSASGYVSQTAPVEITAQQGITQDFALLLDSPWMQLSSDALSATLEVNDVVTQTLIITNSGSAPLDFAIAEGYPLGINQAAGESYIAGTVLLMHMDEPAGATTFFDASGYGNHGTCSGDSCPEAGQPGIAAHAIEFNGDDFITIPDSPELNPIDAVSFSVWIHPYDWNSNRRILQKGSGDNQFILGCNGGIGGTFELKLYGVGVLDTTLPEPGAWHHVVGLYNGSFMQIWVDGQLIAETPASGQIATTNEPLYIGTKHAGAPPSDYFNGLMDDLLIVNRALTPAEIIALYRGVNPTPWLSVHPITGTIPVASVQPIQVAYNSSNLQPDNYTTSLYVTTNDLLQPHIPIPATMTVEPTPTMGWVEGTVTVLRTGEPLEATIVAEGQPYTVTSDAETGHYLLWLDTINGPTEYTLQVSADGYGTQSVQVTVYQHQGVTQDFPMELIAPTLVISPESMQVTQQVGEVITQILTITNTGIVPLEFSIWSDGGSGSSFFAAYRELYGYNVPGAWLTIIGTEDDTSVRVINLDTGVIIDEKHDLERYQSWNVYPNDGTYFKIIADKQVIGFENNFAEYTSFIPSLDSGPTGTEFILYYFQTGHQLHYYVFAVEHTTVEVYDSLGNLVDSRTLSADEYWELSLPAAVYHIMSTGRISIECVGVDGYSTVPSTYGNGVGNRFYFGTYSDPWTGAFAVFAYRDTDVNVFDMDSGLLIYSQHINRGEYWWQTGVGTRVLRLESTGIVGVWAGDAEGYLGIEYLGDDTSFAGGEHGKEFYLHSLMEGSVIFSLSNDTVVNIDGLIYHLNKDEYLRLDGCCYFRHIQSNQPILIQTLGRDGAWNNFGTYLGGVSTSVYFPDWLTAFPVTGTVPVNGSMHIEVIFDASDIQPYIYTSTLYIDSNDPLNPRVQIPITMTVTPPAWYGELSGTASTPGYCDNSLGVLAGAEILIESSTGMTWTMTTDEAGTYNYWLDENGSPYTVTASSPGYETIVASGVSIVGGQTTPLDFSLRWLVVCLSISPQQLPITLDMGTTGTLPLMLTNTGGGVASFELVERDSGRIIPIEGEITRLTIPAGPENAPQGSAVAAGPYTPRPERTYTVQRQAILVDPPRVLLLHADDGDGQWIRDQLLAYGDLAGVDAYNARLDTPTLADLLDYDVVLTWSNYPYADPVGIGDVLADYVDAGGNVINLMYALGEHGWEMEGRFMDEGYNAILGGLVAYGTECLGEHHPTHPILNGVDDVCEFYRLSDTSLTAGSTALARWGDGELFVATGAHRSVVSITGYVGYYFRWTGQMDRLVHNAILWFVLGDDVPWLSAEPDSGSVPADGGSLLVTATFDTLSYQPGEFTADLLLYSNDPQVGEINISVTMTVEPTPSMGWVEGVVTDLRTGEPVEATLAAVGQPYTVTSDTETGYYKLWLEEGSYTIQASAEGYVTQEMDVNISAQQGTVQDFALLLDAAWLQYDPREFEVILGTDQVITRTLTISNAGSIPMEFYLIEEIPGLVLLHHLDEPAGATNFIDSSSFGNHGFCMGDSCPISGRGGVYGTAISLDGIDDMVRVEDDENLVMIDVVTIAAWVYPDPDQSNGNWMIVNKESRYEFARSIDNGNLAWAFLLEDNSGWEWHDTGYYVPFDQWTHVAVVFDHGDVTTYANGLPIEYYDGEGLINDEPYPAELRIGGRTNEDSRFTGMIDEVYVFKEALSAEEIMVVYGGGLFGEVLWLSVDPTSGTVPADSSLPIQVAFDATDLQPDTYTTTLYVTSNDPLHPVVQVPVTMTVLAPGVPLSVEIAGPQEGLAGTAYPFTAVVEPISTTLPVEYIWQASGQEPVTHTGGITDTVAYTWDSPGTKAITVTATNTAGVVSATHTIVISDAPISGLVAGSDSPTPLGSVTTLNATISAGTNVTYTWDFGDETSGAGALVTHTYLSAGVYTSTVTASNNAGQVSASTTVIILAPPITIHLPLIMRERTLETPEPPGAASARPDVSLPAAILLVAVGVWLKNLTPPSGLGKTRSRT